MADRVDLGKFKRHPYDVSFGGTALGPLTAEPAIKIVGRRFEGRNYEDGGAEAETAVIVAAEAELKVSAADAAAALGLIATFSVGDDVLAESRSGRLVFSPPEDSGERTLVFPRAFLLPDLEYAPKPENHSAVLNFVARPDSSGVLFTFD